MASLPTLFEYYTSGGISQGLSSDQPNFTLNKRDITIYSGALHYFRVPPSYWRDRLRKMRAAGLNAVETYIPWNVHQPETHTFDFGNGGSDFSDFLDVAKFLKTAQEEDLLVVVRPGPYICAEWEFGGLPSWLLRDDIKVRTSDPNFIEPVKKYFKELLGILAGLQFTKGGPIIAFQIENEYGNIKTEDQPVDTPYLATLKQILEENGIVELLFTSDTPSNGFFGTLPDVLATANFQDKPVFELSLLKEYQPNKPLMVMEYWTGWFDHWTEKHHTRSAEAFGQVLDEILAFGSSVNMYMFHGGTNWGFLNGGNIKDSSTNNSGYQSDTTSYDYDAPLSEAGDYTEKYAKVKELIRKHNKVLTKLPLQPELTKRVAYPSIQVTEMLPLDDLFKQSNHVTLSKLVAMEMLNINNNSGQSYGYITYRFENLNIEKNSVLKIEGHVCDTIVVLINGQLISKILTTEDDLNGFGYWRLKDSTLDLGADSYQNATVDLLVENWGRSNYGKLNQFNQHKGLWQGDVSINNTVLNDCKVVALEFKKNWTNSLSDWKCASVNHRGPALYKAVLEIEDPNDTYIELTEWNKGIIIVNGFVLARYVKLGPQQAAYLPASLLKKGSNSVLIFEHFTSDGSIKFVRDPVFKTQA